MTNRPLRSTRNYSRTYKAYGHVCAYCGAYADSIDHVMPWSYIPDNSVHNLVPACMDCNVRASNLVFPSFDDKRDYLRAIVTAKDNSDTAVSETDNSGEPLVTDAIWEALNETDETDIEDEYDEQTELRQLGICAQVTRKGRFCQLPAAECAFHDN